MNRSICTTQIPFMNLSLKSVRIVLVTHYRIYSASQALRDYLRQQKCGHLLYISHPLISGKEVLSDRSYLEISGQNKITHKVIFPWLWHSIILNSLRELCLTIWWVIRTGKKYDLYIGVDNLNAFTGLILKLLGRVKKVIYYTIDYFPTRFENKLLNWIYHKIDKICLSFTDETWNVSSMMMEAREKHHGLAKEKYQHQYTVPIGIWYDKVKRMSFARIDKTKLVFVGHLLPHMGVDLILKALPLIAEKIPGVSLSIVGGGPEENKLKYLVHKLKLKSRVSFYGWIKDRKKMNEIIQDGAVGLAPFNTKILDDKVKNADPGKIKDYLAVGMPVIVTDAISTGREITKNRCGIVIHYDVQELVSAVVQLLSNRSRLEEYRKHTLLYVKQFDYSGIFAKALARVLP